MSTDPELPRPDLPALELPRGERSGLDAIWIDNEELSRDNEDGCRTPTSEEHRIPSLMTCPPAPRKTIRGKRGRSEVVSSETELFKAATVSVSMVEVEDFFRRIERVKDRERFQVVVKGDGRRKKSVVLRLR